MRVRAREIGNESDSERHTSTRQWVREATRQSESERGGGGRWAVSKRLMGGESREREERERERERERDESEREREIGNESDSKRHTSTRQWVREATRQSQSGEEGGGGR